MKVRPLPAIRLGTDVPRGFGRSGELPIKIALAIPLIRCAGGWLAITEMKHGFLLLQFDYDLFCPFDSELIADRTSDAAKSFNRLVDRRALVTHGKLPCEAGA